MSEGHIVPGITFSGSTFSAHAAPDPLKVALDKLTMLEKAEEEEWQTKKLLHEERSIQLDHLIRALRSEIHRQTPQVTNAPAGHPQ